MTHLEWLQQRQSKTLSSLGSRLEVLRRCIVRRFENSDGFVILCFALFSLWLFGLVYYVDLV
jgi:hypothetical protein